MRKAIKVLGGAGFVILLGAVGAGYFLIRSHLEELPQWAVTALKTKGIELSYQKAAMAPTGLSLIFTDLALSGSPFPYSVEAKSVSVGLSLAFNAPPLHVNLHIQKSVLKEVPSAPRVETAPPSSPADLPWYVGLLVKGIEFSFSSEDMKIPNFGVHLSTASFSLKGLDFDKTGLSQASVSHELRASEIQNLPLGDNFSWKGLTLWKNNSAQFKNHEIKVGPLPLKLSGNFDRATQKWSADLSVPSSSLGSVHALLGEKAPPWLKAMSGNLELGLEAQGVGAAFSTSSLQGQIKLEALTLNLAHPYIEGEVETDIDIDITKGTTLALEGKIAAELSKAKIQYEDLFYKEKNIPLGFGLEVKGENDKFQITSGEGKLHNLNLDLGGSFALGTQPMADVKLKIPPVSLEGWESFFPKYKNLKTKGTLQGDLSYRGPLKDWRAAELDVALRAQNLQFPLLPAWIPQGEWGAEGWIALNSDTKLALSQAALKSLSTQTYLDLKGTRLTYKDIFQKSKDAPLSVNLAILSNGKKADIKKGELRLGNLLAKITGSIDNFSSPRAAVRFETPKLRLNEILSFLPSLKPKELTSLDGEVALNGNFTGPLLSPQTPPSVNGEVILSRTRFQYQPEAGTHKTQLLEASANLAFTTQSLWIKNLRARFPKTELNLVGEVKDFSKPQIKFALKAPRFSLGDFYDTASVKSPPGSLGVPMTAKETATSDFRSLPILKALKIDGEMNVAEGDLGWATVSALKAHITYDSLLLKISPLSMKTLGGTLFSETEWDGRPETPKTQQHLKVDGVDANRFLSSYSEKIKDVVFGKLGCDMHTTFSGMLPQQIQKSLQGKGQFSLKDGELKTIRLSRQPMQSLKKIPFLAKNISKTEWEEKLGEITGQFKIEEGKVILSDLVGRSSLFDLKASEVTLDFDQNISSKLTWFPKPALLSPESLEAIKDAQGKPSLPLSLSGKIQNPQVALDDKVLGDRLQVYAAALVRKEKDRAISAVKTRAQDQIKNEAGKQFKGGIGDFLKGIK